MPGTFADTSVPAELRHIESTADDGALTFVFYSDIMATGRGWAADVRVVNMKAHDLEASNLQVEALGVAKTEETAKVAVTNKGTQKATGYKVVLLVNGAVVSQVDGPELAPRAKTDVELKFTPDAEGECNVAARIDYTAD